MLFDSLRPIEAGPPAGRRHAGSAFAVFLLGSVAAHAVVLVAFPGFDREGESQSVPVLEVVLQRARPLAVEPREPAGRPVSDRRQRAKVPASAIPETQDARGAPVLMLSEPREVESASFAVELSRLPEPTVTALAREPVDESVAQPAGSNAAYLRNPAPLYPEAARRSGEQGMVTLRVRVARDGAASSVAVERSSGSPHLDAAAQEAVKAWRFTPARRGADAVESWMLVPIVFRLDGAP
jgi:protein TonB